MLHHLKTTTLGSAVALALAAGPAHAADPESCETVHFSDVGWSCITATTAIASKILEALDYEPKATVLSVPVTFKSLSTGDIDAFLGLWLPTQQDMIDPYFSDGSVERLSTNLEGAKYTLAVPKYVYDGGVKSFADLAEFKHKFDGKIYGIEPGNDGNELIQSMIDAEAFDLGGWEVVESSEQGMLSQVDRATRGDDWIVFLGWEPHPMNSAFEMAYLDGGDEWFGADFGGATVYTLTRKDYAQMCPNAARLLSQLAFTLDVENTMMDWMLGEEKMSPEDAAARLLSEQPDLLAAWLDGVTTLDGSQEAVAAVKAGLGM